MRKQIILLLLLLSAVGAKAQPTDYVAYYSFDGGNANDNSGNGYHGTPSAGSTITYVCGKSDLAAYFDGTVNSFIDLGSGLSSAISGNDNFTVAFYVKIDDINFQRSILSKRDACNYNPGFDIRSTVSSTIATELMGGAQNTWALLADSYPSTCWVHYAVTRNGNTLSVYFNGTLVNSRSLFSTSALGSSNWRLGNTPCTGTVDGTRFFNGYIDELKFYDRPLSASEIQSLYTPDLALAGLVDTVCYFDSVQVVLTGCLTSVNWSPSTGVSSPTADTTFIVPVSTQTYNVSVTTSYGCNISAEITLVVDSLCCPEERLSFALPSNDNKFTSRVEVRDTIIIIDTLQMHASNVKLLVPGGFTPNFDGNNDVFEIAGSGVSFIKLQVYDLWGREVYTTSDSKPTWNGQYDGQPSEVGIYVYKIEYLILETGATETRSGSFGLMK